MEKKISIIMPVKNGSNYITEAFNNIKKQKLNIEIIVVNDCSTDNTVEIAKNYGCIILNHEVPKGQIAAKNTGLKVSEGEYIMFHDHDDILTDNALSRMLSVFDEDTEIQVVIAKVKDFISPDATDQNQKLKSEPYYGCLAGSLLIKREVFDKIGVFDESVTAGEIIDLTSRFEKYNIITQKIDFISSNRRIHDTNYGKINRKNEFADYAALLRNKLKK